MNIYDIGDRPTVRGTFVDADEFPATPDEVTALIEDPDGVQTTFTLGGGDVTDEGGGVFAYRLPTVTKSGVWFYRFEGTGSAEAAGESKFRVRKSAF